MAILLMMALLTVTIGGFALINYVRTRSGCDEPNRVSWEARGYGCANDEVDGYPLAASESCTTNWRSLTVDNSVQSNNLRFDQIIMTGVHNSYRQKGLLSPILMDWKYSQPPLYTQLSLGLVLWSHETSSTEYLSLPLMYIAALILVISSFLVVQSLAGPRPFSYTYLGCFWPGWGKLSLTCTSNGINPSAQCMCL